MPGAVHGRRRHVRDAARSWGSRASTSTRPVAAACWATCTADVVVAAFVFFAPGDRARVVGALGVGHARARRPRASGPRPGTRGRWRTFPTTSTGRRSRRCSGASSTPRRLRARRCSRVGARSTSPRSSKALALHRLNALRELRGALHGAAVLTVGLSPVEAIVVRTPAMLPVFGWPEPHPDPKPLHEPLGAGRSPHRPHVRPQPRRARRRRARRARRGAREARGRRVMTWLRAEAAGATPARSRVRAAPERVRDASASCSTGLADGGIDAATLDACRARIDALLRYRGRPDRRARSRRARNAPRSATPSSTHSTRTGFATPTSTRCTSTTPTRSSRPSRSRSPCTTRSLRFSRRVGGLMARVRSPEGRAHAVRPPTPAVGGVQPLLRHAVVRRRGRRPHQGGRPAPQRPGHRLRDLQEPAFRVGPRAGSRGGTRRPDRRRRTPTASCRTRWKLAARLADALIADARVDDELRAALLGRVHRRRDRRAHRDHRHRDRVLEGIGRVRRARRDAARRRPHAAASTGTSSVDGRGRAPRRGSHPRLGRRPHLRAGRHVRRARAGALPRPRAARRRRGRRIAAVVLRRHPRAEPRA